MIRACWYLLVVTLLLGCVCRVSGQDPITSLHSREFLQMRAADRRGSLPAIATSTAPGAAIPVSDLSPPAQVRAEVNKGRELLLTAHKSAEAIGHFRKAIVLAPLYSEAHFLLGVALIDEKRFADAQASFATTTSIDTKNGNAYLALGYTLVEQRKYAEAEEPLLRGLEFEPDNSNGLYDLGRAYYALNRPVEAEKCVRKAISLTPKTAPMHALLGNILLVNADVNGARAEFEEYARLEPTAGVPQALK